MNIKDARNKFFLLAVILLGVIFLSIRSFNYKGKLIKNHIVVCGDIVDMRTGKGTNVIYRFSVNGKTYEFNKPSPKTTFANYEKGISKIYIAVEKGDPNNNQILAEDTDFKDLTIVEKDTANLICK